MDNFLNGFDNSRLEQMLIQAANGRAAKADTINTSTGITMYDLEPRLKTLYPVLYPFVQRCPRVKGNGGVATHWKQLNGVNTTNISLGVSEGNRNANIQVSEQDQVATYKTLGLEANLTFEADEAAEGFDDARMIRTDTLLQSNKIGEEKVVLFGNGDSTLGGALGTPVAPTLTGSTASGTVAAATYVCSVVALTYEGWQYATVAGGVQTTISRTNVDGSVDTLAGGSSNSSAVSASATLASPGTLTATVTPVRGAFAYAWYIGAAKSSAVLAAITTIAKAVIIAPAAGTQVATAITADNSINSLLFTGMIPQVLNPASGAYVNSLNAQPFTSNGNGGITEFDAAFSSMYDTYRVGPQRIFLNRADHQAATKIIIGNGGAPLIRFNSDANSPNRNIVGNAMVMEYLNEATGESVTLETHPYMPKGMVFGYSERLPYNTPNVPTPFRIKYRSRDWYEIEWPLVTRRWQHGQYVSELFQYLAPFSAFCLTDANN